MGEGLEEASEAVARVAVLVGIVDLSGDGRVSAEEAALLRWSPGLLSKVSSCVQAACGRARSRRQMLCRG
eukprot:2617438-Rhodomonas_salina.1